MNLPLIFQRIEGGFILAAGFIIYLLLGYNPAWFAVLFFSFDVSILGYLVNTRIGAFSYNTVHSFVGPSILAVIGLITQNNLCIGYSLIWFAHLGFDRMIGFGLMYPTKFGDSHLSKKQLPKSLDTILNRK